MDLGNYYQLSTTLVRKDIFTLSEILEMLPYELNLYSDLVVAQVEKENQELERAKKAQGQ